MGGDASTAQLQEADRAARLAAALDGGAGVEQALAVLADGIDRIVAVAEHHQVSSGEPAAHPPLPAGCGPRVVDHADPNAVQLQVEPVGQAADEGAIVVAEYGVDRRLLAERVEQVLGQDVAGVEHDVAAGEVLPHLDGQLAQIRPEMGVGQDEHTHPRIITVPAMTEPAAPPSVVHPSGVIPQALVDKIVARRGGRLHMYPTLDGPRTAFVVIDLDEHSCTRAENIDDLYGPVNAVSAAVRAAGGAVAFVTTSIPSPEALAAALGDTLAAEYFTQAAPGGASTRLAARLDVEPDDLRAVKARASAFFPGNCDLSGRLRARVEHVLVGGMVTNVCCESSARDAHELGYRVTMVSDGLWGQSFGLHEASLATFFRIFGDIRPSHEVVELLK